MSAQLIRLILQRIGLGVLTLFLISILIFLAAEILPGDVAQTILGQSATPENLRNLRIQLGLDKPPLQRYFNWLGGVLQGNFGTALTNRQPVAKLIGARFGNTLFLASVSALIAVPLAIVLGLLAVRFRDKWLDKFISGFTLTTISLPEFFVGYVLILFFAIRLPWFPSLSTVSASMSLGERLYAIVLPCATLTLVVLAHMMRMTRAAIIGVMSSPYIEMAQLKGVSPFNIIFRHALPNAISPIINVVVVNLAYLIVGVVVVEVIFVYPGMGQLFVDNVSKRDLPVVQACGLIFATVFIGLNMLADVLSIIGNPKLRYPK
jgi:peptide/nickel transport system permease protein